MNLKRLLVTAGLLLVCAGAAKATTPTVIGSTTAPAAYDVTPSSITPVAADVSNGNSFTHTGREILIAYNSDTAAHTVTVTSVADATGRTGDTTKNINGGAYYVFQQFPALGWRQTDGTIHFSATDATVKFFVIRLP